MLYIYTRIWHAKSNIIFLSLAKCTDLNDPDFGSVSVTGLILGSVATYMCNPGYTLVGNMTRDCVQVDNSRANWSDKAPVCTCALKNFKFTFLSNTLWEYLCM